MATTARDQAQGEEKDNSRKTVPAESPSALEAHRHSRVMEIARKIMRRDRELLHNLAK